VAVLIAESCDLHFDVILGATDRRVPPGSAGSPSA
jgi:hypothetical protein